jgi:hypothetical protein
MKRLLQGQRQTKKFKSWGIPRYLWAATNGKQSLETPQRVYQQLQQLPIINGNDTTAMAQDLTVGETKQHDSNGNGTNRTARIRATPVFTIIDYL